MSPPLGFLPSAPLPSWWTTPRAKSFRPVVSPTAVASPPRSRQVASRPKKGQKKVGNGKVVLLSANGGDDGVGFSDNYPPLRKHVELLPDQPGPVWARNGEASSETKGVTEIKGVPTERKAHGYWNDLPTVLTELQEVNVLLGRSRKKIMPTTKELKSLGRLDLIGGMGKHGGIKAVARLLQWSYGKERNKVVRRPRADELPIGMTVGGKNTKALVFKMALAWVRGGGQRLGARAKISRLPMGFWNDFEVVERFVTVFMEEFEFDGIMPTGSDFKKGGHGSLLYGVRKHGGLVVVARRMGLKSAQARKSRDALEGFDYVAMIVLDFIGDSGEMPTATELKAARAYDVLRGIELHGGFPNVAAKLGLRVRNLRNEGRTVRWNIESLKQDLSTFTATFHPSLAVGNHMPTEAQLRRAGRNDLSYAISKLGGHKKVEARLGLVPKPVGPRPGVLPTRS